MAHKIPVSALVLVYTRDLDVLLIERADFPDHWQSVTGSQEPGEALVETGILSPIGCPSARPSPQGGARGAGQLTKTQNGLCRSRQ